MSPPTLVYAAVVPEEMPPCTFPLTVQFEISNRSPSTCPTIAPTITLGPPEYNCLVTLLSHSTVTSIWRFRMLATSSISGYFLYLLHQPKNPNIWPPFFDMDLAIGTILPLIVCPPPSKWPINESYIFEPSSSYPGPIGVHPLACTTFPSPSTTSSSLSI